ncbi:ABC transporter permease subunit [Ferrovibrio terrae]|uniref:ABC transporter permease subunit n=1 Tax=Ferrovibrio terrae TaxID=2594003 RepID=A0A516H3V6_9PROT|nr:ABC transporter permease [Ferrovibrio terrae]QDO98458.1 ABC transporter permease subunit [Ferrovibrio terrae]
MNTISDAFLLSLQMMAQLDPELLRIIGLSLRVSLTAVVIGSILGLPLGALLALTRFPGRDACVVVLNACMGLPPVVVGLIVYLILSRSGPLGTFGWLFTPAGMVMAQVVLITPIVAALSRQTVADLWIEYEEQLRSLGLTPLKAIATLLWDGRFSLSTAVFAGFGRAIAEVGAIIIVGGNINGFTRTMTTAISLETSRGDLALAMALGIVLLAIAISINAAASALGNAARRRQGA